MSDIRFLHVSGSIVINHVNPFKQNEIYNYYQLDQSISVLRDVGWYFSSLFNIRCTYICAHIWIFFKLCELLTEHTQAMKTYFFE